MINILVFGSSGHAKVVIDIIRTGGRYHIIGLIDSFRDIGQTTLGLRVLGAEEDLPRLIADHDVHGIVIAVGDNFMRACIAKRISDENSTVNFVTVIHPNTSIGSDVTIGKGTVIMPGARINACCQIGDFCIINTNSSLDHDCVMGDYASLAPGVVTGGNSTIGNYTAICIGTCIAHGIQIGDHSVIGAGSTVIKDVGAYKVAFGTPASEQNDRSEGEKYL